MSTSDGPVGVLRRLTGRLGKQGDPARPDRQRSGRERAAGSAEPIGRIEQRSRVTVLGELKSVTIRPRQEVPALVAELADATGSVELVWLGRRTIPGIDAGTRLRVTGRVTLQRRTPTIFNPAYEIVPTQVPTTAAARTDD